MPEDGKGLLKCVACTVFFNKFIVLEGII